MPNGLTFVIDPDAKTISVELLAKALNDIGRLLKDVDYAVHRDNSSGRWVVVERLHSRAPAITVEPMLGDRETVKVVADGIWSITAGITEPPPYFTEDALVSLKRMRRLFAGKDRARAIFVAADPNQTTTIEKAIGKQTDRILSAGYWNLASIEGELDAPRVQRSASFTVWDRISNAPVKCSLADDSTIIKEAKELLGKRVVVRGKVSYFSNGVPRAITGVVEIAGAISDPTLPRAGFGSIPDAEAAGDPAGFLRTVRGGEE